MTNRIATTLLLKLSLAGAADDRFDRIANKVIESVNALNADALYSLYDAAMKNAFPADRTREFMQGLQAQFGNTRKIESSERPVATTRRFRLQFERGPLIMEITVNANDTIAAGSRNEDYYAFGREILAPADGVVTDVISGVSRQQARINESVFRSGNTVLIEHRPGEVSVLAHLQFASVVVKPGDRVSKGQIVGLCGNSGNSSEPRLHYHLQNSTMLAAAFGIKVGFATVKLLRDGKAEMKTGYSPIKGTSCQRNERMRAAT